MYLYIGPSMGKFNSVPPNATVYQGELAGGATDIRLQGGEFYDFNSLKSRIMVAASGGSREHHLSTLSPAGSLFSIESNTSDRYNNNFLFTLYGANQTHPGFSSDIRGISGTFGIAGYIVDPTQDWGAISGNGYYAGCSSSSYGGSTGGSSFISGHPGCDAISKESSSFVNIIHTAQPIHYSKLSFFNTKMIDGQRKVPLPWIYTSIENSTTEELFESTRSGHGFIRITFINDIFHLTCNAITIIAKINFLLYHELFVVSE